MKEIIITKQEENQRLDKFLLKYFNTAPKAFIYKMLRKKRIKLNTKKAEGNEMLAEGNTLQFYLAEETMSGFMEEKKLDLCERHFGIIYEDDQILLVSKPAGLLTHPEKPGEKNTLIDQILSYLYEKGQYLPTKESSFTPAVCNRLDRNTSGLIIAGKTLAAVQNINEAIAQHRLEKNYLTMVKGKITKEGTLSGWLKKEERNNQVKVTIKEQEGSKQVITKYRPLKNTADFTMLEIQLVTGKSHQIRAHLKAIGHPVVGDRKYGDEKVNQIFKEQYALSNQFLHAYKLTWKQSTGILSYLMGMEFTAPLPIALRKICQDYFEEEW